MSGYINCACRDCFEIAIGEPGDMCLECEEAGCEAGCECCCDDAYDDIEASLELGRLESELAQ